MANKPEVTIDPRTGDKPAETLGHVVPGKALRERLWGSGVKAPKVEPAPEDVLPPDEEPELTPEQKAAAEAEAKRQADEAAAASRDKKGRFTRTKPAPAAQRPIGAKEIEEITTNIVKTALKKDEPKPVDPLAALDARARKKYEVFKRMEKLNPDNKGKADEFLALQTKLAEYRKTWEADKANKGKKFNLLDEEHEEFLAGNDVNYDPDEYAEAMADLRAEEVTKPIREQLSQTEVEREQQRRRSEIQPEINAHQKATILVFRDQLGGDFKEMWNDGGLVVPEKMNNLAAQGKVHKQIINMAAQTEVVAGELKAIANGVTQFSDKNPLHVQIYNFIDSQEKAMMKLPAEQRLDGENREFLPASEWNKLSESERTGYWTFNDNDLSSLYAVEMATSAQRLLDEAEQEFTAIAQRRGYVKGGQNPPPAPVPTPTPVPPKPARPAPSAEPRSPAGTVAPRLAPTAVPAKTNTNSFRDRLFARK